MHRRKYVDIQESGFTASEVAVMKESHHENIVEWFRTIETTIDLYVVLEFCGGWTLYSYVQKKNGLSEADAKIVFVQILSAIFYMHSKSMLQQYTLSCNYISKMRNLT